MEIIFKKVGVTNSMSALKRDNTFDLEKLLFQYYKNTGLSEKYLNELLITVQLSGEEELEKEILHFASCIKSAIMQVKEFEDRKSFNEIYSAWVKELEKDMVENKIKIKDDIFPDAYYEHYHKNLYDKFVAKNTKPQSKLTS